MTDYKPPLGLKPRWLADKHRLADVDAALGRYTEAGMIPPSEWLKERRDLVRSLLQHRPTDAAMAQPEPAAPSDEELLRTYGAAKREYCYDGPIEDRIVRAIRAATVHGLRAVLARWGTTPQPANGKTPTANELQGMATMFGLEVNDWAALSWLVGACITAYWDGPTPTPPDDGELPEEVATLIPWLLEEAAQAANAGRSTAAGLLTLAAQLLGERGPTLTPIPVSERPILKRDPFNDDQGRCWCGTKACVDASGDIDVDIPPSWELRKPCAQDDALLPSHALPLPAAPGEEA